MNRAEFIKKIMNKHMQFFTKKANQEQAEIFIDSYKLIPENWDFEKLYKIFLTKFNADGEHFYLPPDGAWLLNFRDKCTPKSSSNKFLEEVEKLKVTAVAPTKEIRALYQRLKEEIRKH